MSKTDHEEANTKAMDWLELVGLSEFSDLYLISYLGG